MPWNLLILPLIAGYYVYTRFNFFKFKQQRLDRQRLIFDSIFLGVIFFILALFLKKLSLIYFEPFIIQVYDLIPYKTNFIGTAIATLVIAVLITEIGNKTTHRNRNKEIKKAIKSVGNELELILASSFTDSKLLQFTLDTGKFYIAWVKELPIPTVSEYIRLIPAFSGYRDEEQKMIFTTQYLNVYAKYITEGKIDNIQELDIDLILPVKNVVHVSYFDIDMYEHFNGIASK